MRQCLRQRRVDDVSHHWRLFGREAADVLRDAPQLLVSEKLVLQEVAERRHRCAVEPGAQAVVDVLHATAAVEPPVFVQIGGEDRVLCVVLERGRRRTVPASLVTVTLAAADRVVELSPHAQRFGAAPPPSGRTPEFDGLWPLGRISKVRAECLDIGEHITALAIGESSLPCGHRRAGQPFIYRAPQIGVGGKLAARRRTYLIEGVASEIARWRDHMAGTLTVAFAVHAVAASAPLHVDGLARGGVLRKEQGAVSWEQESAKNKDLLNHACFRLLAPRSLRLPTSVASIPSDHRGRAPPTRSRPPSGTPPRRASPNSTASPRAAAPARPWRRARRRSSR